MNINVIIDLLGSFNYAVITYLAMTAVVYFVHDIPRERIKNSDPDSYRKIMGDNSWLFDSGGGSPADISAYFRFFRYVVSRDAKTTIGKSFWLFYRIIVPLYFVSIIWLILSLIVSMVTA